MSLSLLAPCKINLFLHVLGRRPDGYHELQTLFQLLHFGDTLTFERLSGKPRIELECNDPSLVTPENLVFKAASWCLSQCKTPEAIRIYLQKKVPIGGGLGGGSSDAATTLLGLNRLLDLGCSIDTLATVGLKLGADVPVFVRGHSAWGEGVGDRLTPILLPPRWYVLIHPGCSVQTSTIFQNAALTRNTPPSTLENYVIGWGHNDLEPVVRQLYPAVAAAMDWLAGEAKPCLSGSGSVIFAAFDNREKAAKVASLVPAPWHGWVAEGLNQSPLYPL